MKTLILFLLLVGPALAVTPTPTPDIYYQDGCVVAQMVEDAGKACGSYDYTTGVFTKTSKTHDGYVVDAFKALGRANLLLVAIPDYRKTGQECPIAEVTGRMVALKATLTPYWPKPTPTATPATKHR